MHKQNIKQNQKVKLVNEEVDDLDLDIDNYSLEEILELFNIPLDFEEQDLKQAKQKVLKTHPDKSGLDSSYFIFYSKAYKTLFSIWEFKNRTKLAKTVLDKPVEYYVDTLNSHKTNYDFTKDKKQVLDQFMSKKKYLKDPQKFNKWFNENFDKMILREESVEKGYGEWLQSEEGLNEDDMNNPIKAKENFFAKKKKAREEAALILREDEPSGLYLGSGGAGIGGDAPQTYECGDIFSKLPYEDLRKAHTETVIPVTEEDDFHNVRRFRNVNEYSQHRSEEEKTMVPLSQKQAKEYLANKERLHETESTQRAFRITKQAEEMGKRQDTFWSGLQRLMG
jgi:L-rhamnose mutarotase